MLVQNLINVLVIIFYFLHLGESRKRRESEYPCFCGVRLPIDNGTVNPWSLYVHVAVGLNETRTCLGIVTTSSVVLTPGACLIKESESSNGEGSVIASVADIEVNDNRDKGKGSSFRVKAILKKKNCSKLIGLHVDYDFTSRSSIHKPICIPTKGELANVVAVGRNVSYESVEAGVIPNLIVKKGQDCDKDDGLLQLGTSEEILCVIVSDNEVKLETGQFLYLEVGKNPSETYPFGFFSFLVGISTFIWKNGNGQRQVFFTPIKPFLDIMESITEASDNRWCSLPWPWLNPTGSTKRAKTLNCECGIVSEKPQGRIVGGEDAVPYEFPWMVKLGLHLLQGGAYINEPCGGTIINDRIILTAGHCLTSFDLMYNGSVGYEVQALNHSYTPYLHSHKRNNDSEEIPFFTRLGLVHPAFVDAFRSGPRFEVDIALVILDEPLDFTKLGSDGEPLYRPICLPNQGEPIQIDEKEALITGWGRNSTQKEFPSPESILPDVLQKGTVIIQPIDVCRKQFSEAFKSTGFCTLNYNGTHTFRGDSGGPISVPDRNGKQTQVGLTSYGVAGVATVFTNVQELLPWVDYYSDMYGGRYCKN